MRWSFKIGAVRGIGIYVHVTFLMLLAWVAWEVWRATADAALTARGVAFVLVLFFCIVLHELGHALMAGRFGIPTRDITLLPIGGLARLDRMPESPIQEFLVAVAGPAVNVLIAGVLAAVLLVTEGGFQNLGGISLIHGSFLQHLMVVNIALIIFNMVPAFPMDGGRVLRSLLALVLSYERATWFAARLGQTLAVLFGLFAVSHGNPFHVLLAVFVWFGARQESEMVQTRHAVQGTQVHRAMMTQFWVLAPGDPIARIVELVLAGTQHDFPVVQDGVVVGVVTRRALTAALARDTHLETAADVMSTHFDTVEAAAPLSAGLEVLQGSACPVVPVLHEGRLAGLLSAENLGEFMMLQQAGALRRTPPPLPQRS